MAILDTEVYILLIIFETKWHESAREALEAQRELLKECPITRGRCGSIRLIGETLGILRSGKAIVTP